MVLEDYSKSIYYDNPDYILHRKKFSEKRYRIEKGWKFFLKEVHFNAKKICYSEDIFSPVQSVILLSNVMWTANLKKRPHLMWRLARN